MTYLLDDNRKWMIQYNGWHNISDDTILWMTTDKEWHNISVDNR